MAKKPNHYEIQKGIPLPDVVYPGGLGRGVKVYPFDDMKVKDCFTFPVARLRAVAVAINKYQRVNANKKFAIRTIDESTGGCWRIKA